jgi:hypothetical protein
MMLSNIRANFLKRTFIILADLRNFVTPANMKKLDTKEEAKKEVKKAFESRYLERGKNTSGVQYFFNKLRF